MEFKIFFEVIPPGPFGLPDIGTGVPSDLKEGVGDTYHRSGARVGYGTLSCYRDGDHKIAESFTLGGYQTSLNDDFLCMRIEAASSSEAHAIARGAVDRYTQRLSVSAGRLFQARTVLIEDEAGDDSPTPVFTELEHVAVYSLDRPRQSIREAASLYHARDDRLSAALRYHMRGLHIPRQTDQPFHVMPIT